MSHLPDGFDPQVTLSGQGLPLVPLTAQHRSVLTEVASDPRIWQGHPAKDRHKPEVFNPYFDILL